MTPIKINILYNITFNRWRKYSQIRNIVYTKYVSDDGHTQCSIGHYEPRDVTKIKNIEYVFWPSISLVSNNARNYDKEFSVSSSVTILSYRF